MSINDKILKPSPDALEKAANSIRSGKLVSFATETVYGLGADATNGEAVAGIFEAKGRPSFNPLIVHVPDLNAAQKLVHFSPFATKLAEKFWPGPISFVLPRKDDCPVSELASAGLPTLAIRIPSNEAARAFLQAAARPVAAPSANPSGKISPTTAQHVADGLGDKVAYILDGGDCAVGLESTVISVQDDRVTLLRPGGISKEELEAIVGTVEIANADSEISSPGMLLSHYAPGCPVRLNATDKQEGEAFLAFGDGFDHISDLNLSKTGDLKEAAAKLFAAFHKLDAQNPSQIAVAPIPQEGIGAAINDRLKRAAAPRN